MGTELSNRDHVDVAALNEALILGLVRQHELTDEVEQLNTKLLSEMNARSAAEAALVSNERIASVGRMAAVLAHEINNPLEAVTNVLFLAQTTDGLPERARQYLMLADLQLRRIAHIARQTLGFYREQSAAAPFHFAALIESVVDLLGAKVVSRRATIERQCDADIQMTAFEGEIRQVLANLLLNSLDAINEGGRVVLRARYSSNGRRAVRISVADNGKGIPKDIRDQIFDPFFTTKGSVGNGLGLWVSRQIIEKHGGFIRVRSRLAEPRKGTTFTLVLPLHQGK